MVLRQKHMFHKSPTWSVVMGAYGARDQAYDAFHVVFGIEGVSRDDFDPYVP